MQPSYTTEPDGGPKKYWLMVSTIVLALFFIIFMFYGFFHHRPVSFPQADQLQATTYEGMSSFIDRGLSTDQVNGVMRAFSKFSPSAQTVSVDTESLVLYPGPKHDGTFFVKFDVSVDSEDYKGTVSFSDIESIRMVLYDQNGKNIFNSGVVTASSP